MFNAISTAFHTAEPYSWTPLKNSLQQSPPCEHYPPYPTIRPVTLPEQSELPSLAAPTRAVTPPSRAVRVTRATPPSRAVRVIPR